MTKTKIVLYSLGAIGGLIAAKKVMLEKPLLETRGGVSSLKFNVLDQIKTLTNESLPEPIDDLALTSAITDFLNLDDSENNGDAGLDVADLDVDVSLDTGSNIGTDIGFGILGVIGHAAIDLGNALTGSLFGNLAKGLHKGLTDMIDNAQEGLDADSAVSPGSDASPGGEQGPLGHGGNPDIGQGILGGATPGPGGDADAPGLGGPSSPGVTGGGEGEGGYGGY